MITIICALAENRAIGFENRLLYHLSADLQRFKALTTGHTVLMGRRTFESLPKGALPRRRNIVLSGNAAFRPEGAEVFDSLEKALEACKGEEVYVIGGESVYEAAMPLADRLCLTHVHATPEVADAFFPVCETACWKCVFSERHEADEKNAVPFTFVDYVRK